MDSSSNQSISKLIDLLSNLPTIGKKSARRLVFHLLKSDVKYISELSNTLLELKSRVFLCETCFNYTESNPCTICSSKKRNQQKICVVEEPSDINLIENTNDYNGLYHVLHGVINPIEGIGVEDLKIKELISRLQNVDEVILALNPKVESEITAQYIAKYVKPMNIKVSKIASGIPMGLSLEFSDALTLSRALEGRIEL